MAHVVDNTYGRNRDLGQVTDPALLAYYAGIGYTIDGTVTGTTPGPPAQTVFGLVVPYGATDGEVVTVAGGGFITAPVTGGGGGGSVTKAAVIATGLAAIDIAAAPSLPENGTALTASGNLTVGKVTPINSTSGVVVATLPAGTADAQTLGVRFKTGSNAASVTGTISGATNTIVMIPGELLVFRWDAGTTSWWSQAGNKPLTALDARFAPAGNYVAASPAPAAWQASHAYTVGQTFTQSGTTYVVATAYTSGASFGATDTANAFSMGTSVTVGTTVGTVAAGDDSRITSAVPNTRTVNGKALSANVALSASDIPGSFVGGPLDFLPAQESGLPVEIARYDADSVSPQTDATSVSSWPDDTGTTGALTQATGANQPVLKLAQVNGHSAVRFSGGNFWMSKAISASSNFTIICVGKPGTTVNFSVGLGNLLAAYSGRISASGQGAPLCAATAYPGWAIYRLTVVSGTGTLYRNGVPIASATTSNLTTLFVGQDGGNNFYSDWDITHIRVYNSAIMPEEGTAIEKSLGRRYAITTGPGAPSVRSRTNTTLNGQNIALCLPETYIKGQSLPLLVCSHGGGGNYDSFFNYSGAPGGVMDAALALGYAVASSDLHGDSTGNAQQLQDNLDLVNYVKGQISVSKLVLFGQSLGGLPTLNAITKNTYASTGLSVQGALLIYPVISMTDYPAGASGTNVIASYSLSNGTLSSSASIGATTISSSVLYASGTVIQINTGANLENVTVTGAPTGSGPYATPVTALTKNHSSGVLVSDYPTKVTNAGYDPATQPASAFGNKRYRFYGSASDGVVNVTTNIVPFQTKVAATAREATYVATRGAHGDQSNFNGRDQAQFLIRCLNDPVIV